MIIQVKMDGLKRTEEFFWKTFSKNMMSRIIKGFLKDAIDEGEKYGKRVALANLNIQSSRTQFVLNQYDQKVAKKKFIDNRTASLTFNQAKIDSDYFHYRLVNEGVQLQYWKDQTPFVIKGAAMNKMKTGKVKLFMRLARVNQKAMHIPPGQGHLIEYTTKKGTHVSYMLRDRTLKQRVGMRSWKWKEFEELQKKEGRMAEDQSYRTPIYGITGASIKGLMLRNNEKCLNEVKDEMLKAFTASYTKKITELLKGSGAKLK